MKDFRQAQRIEHIILIISNRYINYLELVLLCRGVTTSNSILIIGAGPIVIGQACEFDYSGTQACKALREEGYRVMLVNSNPATIMTDPASADSIYIEPIQWRTIERIIEKERPDAMLADNGRPDGSQLRAGSRP